MIRKKILVIVIFCFFVIGIIGCGSAQNQIGISAEILPISYFSVSPNSVNIEIENTIQFEYIATDKNGNPVEGVPTWEVIGDVGEITASGLFSAKNIGAGTVKAILQDKVASCSVIVTDRGNVTWLVVLDQWISPNGDSANDTMSFGYSLPEKRNIALKIYAATGEEIGTLYSGEKEGSNIFVWDGKIVETSSVVPDGEYVVRILVDDVVTTKWVNIYVDTIKPTLVLNTDLPAISPNGDGIKDTLNISYSASDNISSAVDLKLLVTKNESVVDVIMDKSLVISSESAAGSLVWNGEISSVVLENNYILELEVRDLAGNFTIATTEVIVDVQSPQINSVNLSNPYFSPNADGNKDSTKVSFNLYDAYSDKINVNILVETESGELVAKIVEDTELALGEHAFTWEGAADGKYKLRVFAEDLASNQVSSELQTVVVDTASPEIINLIADPNPFTPNNDGIKDETTFSYLLSEPCDTELKIMKDDETTLFRNYYRSNIAEESLSWNGSDTYGEILGQSHPYFLIAEDKAGNITTSESGIITVNYGVSLVSYAFAAPDPFSPVNPNNNYTEIRYGLENDNSCVSITVQGLSTVKTILSDEIQNKGEHSVKWYGDYDPGYTGPTASFDPTKIADGMWTIEISVQHPDYAAACTGGLIVRVDNVPPWILTSPVTVDEPLKKASFVCSIPENSTVEVTVRDLDDNVIDVVLPLSSIDAGDHPIEWVGTETGVQYHFNIKAIDRALNQDETDTENFSF